MRKHRTSTTYLLLPFASKQARRCRHKPSTWTLTPSSSPLILRPKLENSPPGWFFFGEITKPLPLTLRTSTKPGFCGPNWSNQPPLVVLWKTPEIPPSVPARHDETCGFEAKPVKPSEDACLASAKCHDAFELFSCSHSNSRPTSTFTIAILLDLANVNSTVFPCSYVHHVSNTLHLHFKAKSTSHATVVNRSSPQGAHHWSSDIATKDYHSTQKVFFTLFSLLRKIAIPWNAL